MFTGKPTNVITALVVCTQIMASLFLSILMPAPQSLAREGKVQFEATDVAYLPEHEHVEASSRSFEATAVELVEKEPEVAIEDQEFLPMAEEVPSVPAISTDEAVNAQNDVPSDNSGGYGADQLRTQGVICDGDYRYTWYSQRVLPGGGLDIDGRHVSDEGYVVDAEGRIVVASSDLPWGTELAVPFGCGTAIVLDSGCASGVIDIYTDF